MFKKISTFLVTLILLMSMTPQTVIHANASPKFGLIIHQKIYHHNFHQTHNDISLIPAHDLVSLSGGTFSFEYKTLTGTLKYAPLNLEAVFTLDSDMALINGVKVKMPAPMKIIQYRIYIPADFIANLLGCNIYYDQNKKIIHISRPSNGYILYSVVPGDTLWLISNVFKSSIASIKQWNNLNGDMIYSGQMLLVDNKDQAKTYDIPSAVTSNYATVFKEPSLNAGAEGYLKPGVSVNIINKNGNWYHANTPSGKGYLHYTILSVSQGESAPIIASTMFSGRIPVDTSLNNMTSYEYTVKSGDTLWLISENNRTTIGEICQLNGIQSTQPLFIGQKLKIPQYQIAPKTLAKAGHGEILDWFSEGQYVFPIGETGRLIDPVTGKSFSITRTIGASHADVETNTLADTQVYKEIFNHQYSWTRKPMLLVVNGRTFAVSISGMPHAGVDGMPFLANVSHRSDNWGFGPNYDKLPGNGMDGHFDLYFLNSLRHSDNKIDSEHQKNVFISGGVH